MKSIRIIIPAVISIFLLGAGCSLTTTVNVNNGAQTNINTSIGNQISYPGQDGKNALELLQLKYNVDVTAEGFVNAINGRKPGAQQFWAFYINNQSANVGAKEYQTKNGDTIEWKLTSF